MRWRRVPPQVRSTAERRLADVARQWRPPEGPLAPQPPDRVDDIGWRWSEAEEEPPRGMRLGPWGRPALRGLALLLALLVALAAYGAWLGRPRAVAQAPEVLAVGTPMTPPATPSTVTPSPPSAPGAELATPAPVIADVVVHVTGLVAHPGLVRLPAGSRVADAIDEAGGVTRRRAAESVNLARVLVDGEQVVVSEAAPIAAAGVPAQSGPPAPLDLNTATAEALDTLPGVGPVLASRIVSWRQASGPFRSVEELGEVSGIGDAILSQVRALVRV